MIRSASNFTGTVVSRGGEDVHPRSRKEIKACVSLARDKGLAVRVVGNGLSFNGIAQQDDAMRVHLTTHMNRIRRVHEEGVVVQTGITLFALCESLARHGRALRNIPHFGGMTLGGALATGIHGTSGVEGCDTLSSSIVSIDMINGHAKRVTLPASESITLGMLGVVYQVTLRTVPLFDVWQRAARIIISNVVSMQAIASADLATHDWVMYKYLCGSGARADTCVRETFDRVEKYSPDLVSSLVNSAQTVLDDVKTWCKYFFPATPAATQVPWRNNLYVWVCERQHRAEYFRAMMGPQVISPHAELEWCVPMRHLDRVLAEIDAFVDASSSSDFYRQPIECHLRFSPPDTTLGHCAFGEGKREWFAWVNLNVRQHLDQATHGRAWEPIEAILMRYDARVHWSKCWSSSPALMHHVLLQQAPFLAHLSRLSARHDPHRLFCSNTFARQLGMATVCLS